uniref:Uncharacterized protein n=1 Tax=Panagrolaimus sp. JU765 TaxID=591449 RepID=A0AC34QF65_9BILA
MKFVVFCLVVLGVSAIEREMSQDPLQCIAEHKPEIDALYKEANEVISNTNDEQTICSKLEELAIKAKAIVVISNTNGEQTICSKLDELAIKAKAIVVDTCQVPEAPFQIGLQLYYAKINLEKKTNCKVPFA